MRDLHDERAFLQTASLVILATVAIAGVLYATRSVMIPFVLAVFIASVVSPIVDFQVLKLKLPRPLAVTGALLVVLAIVAVFGFVIAYAGDQVVARAASYFQDIDAEIIAPLNATLAQWDIGNGLEPKLLGNELQLHPLTILLALSIWGLLWGPIGMLLAVPITAIIRIILIRFETVRPVGNLLAGELPKMDRQSAKV